MEKFSKFDELHIYAGSIIRFGSTLTGRYNHPTTKFGRGLECDKMSKKAVKAAWDGMMGIVVKNAGPLAGTALKGSLIDSYEVGVQNWTDTFRDDFRRLRGLSTGARRRVARAQKARPAQKRAAAFITVNINGWSLSKRKRVRRKQ